jgi:hypothetical protein
MDSWTRLNVVNSFVITEPASSGTGVGSMGLP